MKRKCLTILTLVLLASLLLTPVQATLTRYIWDNVHFMEGRDDQHDIKYPHPDRDYYDISRFIGWSIKGTRLYHEQMDYDWSQTNGACVLGVCTAIGATIGLMIGHPEIGIVAGAALGVVAVIANLDMEDEEGCIWWWISVASVDWLEENQEMLEDMSISNPIGMYYLILDNFWARGYLRLGSTTLYDAIDAGHPSPPTLTIEGCLGGTTDPPPGTYTYDSGTSVIVKADSYPNNRFTCWGLDGEPVYDNPITVTMNSSHTLKVWFHIIGGANGCPTLFVWDGTAYAEEGILDIHADSDVTVQHEIQNTLALKNGVYNLQLRELDNFTSHIDQVKLYAVDYEGEWHSCPLTYAYHSELGKVKHTLKLDDDTRVDLAPTETIDLEFAQPIPYSKTAYFIFEINGYNLKPHPK